MALSPLSGGFLLSLPGSFCRPTDVWDTCTSKQAFLSRAASSEAALHCLHTSFMPATEPCGLMRQVSPPQLMADPSDV